jgi:hypothetical protein
MEKILHYCFAMSFVIGWSNNSKEWRIQKQSHGLLASRHWKPNSNSYWRETCIIKNSDYVFNKDSWLTHTSYPLDKWVNPREQYWICFFLLSRSLEWEPRMIVDACSNWYFGPATIRVCSCWKLIKYCRKIIDFSNWFGVKKVEKKMNAKNFIGWDSNH